MDIDLEKAKEMYFSHGCNTFYMNNEGVLQKYKGFGITRIQEDEWRKEYIAYWIGQLKTEELRPIERLRDSWAFEALPELIQMTNHGDSLTQLWCANAIWHLASNGTISSLLTDKAINAAKTCWQMLIEHPIKLSESHRKFINVSMISALNATTPESYIINYAQRKLDEYKSQGNR